MRSSDCKQAELTKRSHSGYLIPDLTSGTYRLQINYDTVAQSAHTLDYLATYNKTVTAADACDEVADCATGTNTTISLPDTLLAQ